MTDPVASTPDLIRTAVERFVKEVPALAPLKLVFQLELRGRGDVQLYRVQMPGPEIKKAVADDARITISMPRSHFNELAADGKLKNYREAYDTGQIKITGEAGVMKLVGQVVERHEQRARTKKVH
jgi:hypothetical protein